MTDNKKQLLLNIPDNLLDQVEEWQKNNYFATRTPAILALIQKGLESEAKK